MTTADSPAATPLAPVVHRVLTAVVWSLLALGLLAWFILGANRPLDPRLAPGVGLPPLAGQTPAGSVGAPLASFAP